jgi:TRAP-type mannitol/chloroaromatic compound transport system permease small subunit
LPFRYLLKATLIAMPILMGLQGLAEMGRSILVLAGQGHLLEEDMTEHPL